MKSKHTKESTLAHWQSLPENLPILPHMSILPYKSRGSTYGACGIRIDGNPEFIDAVLSRLKDLMEGESIETRLGLSRAEVDGSNLGKQFDNREAGAEVVYIRLHERGNEGKILQSYMHAAQHRQRNRAAKGSRDQLSLSYA
jgi:hypothetical protein